MIKRRRFEQAFTLKDRLAQEIEQLRDQAKNMKPGVALDQVLRRIQQRQTASAEAFNTRSIFRSRLGVASVMACSCVMPQGRADSSGADNPPQKASIRVNL